MQTHDSTQGHRKGANLNNSATEARRAEFIAAEGPSNGQIIGVAAVGPAIETILAGSAFVGGDSLHVRQQPPGQKVDLVVAEVRGRSSPMDLLAQGQKPRWISYYLGRQGSQGSKLN